MKPHMKRIVLPFTAIVGQPKLKQALLLNATNPGLQGLLVRGEKGIGKSTAVRALADLLPEIEVVRCPFNCSPNGPSLQCSTCSEAYNRGDGLATLRRKTKVVELPLGATEDRVVGTLDIEKALREGIKALQPGILAEVNQGILYIDEVNLLDDHLVDVLLDSAAMGVNIVEREGISISHPSRFMPLHGNRYDFDSGPGGLSMNKIRMSYFEKEDILHVVFADEPESGSVELSPGVTAELNAQGELIGVEILNASAFIRDTILETVQVKMLAQEGAQAA